MSEVYLNPLPRFALVLHCLQVPQSTSSLDHLVLSCVLLSFSLNVIVVFWICVSSGFSPVIAGG